MLPYCLADQWSLVVNGNRQTFFAAQHSGSNALSV